MILHFLRPSKAYKEDQQGFYTVYSSICINSEYIVRVDWQQEHFVVHTTNTTNSFEYISENLKSIAKYLGETIKDIQIIDKPLSLTDIEQ